jgi:uncharacterized glyoxalase superfamily protein PhnB
VFPTPDIIRTAEFYEQKLGFKAVPYLNAKDPHICLYRDSTELILTKTNGQKVISNRQLYGYGYDAYFITKNQENLLQEFIDASVKIVRPLEKTDYKNREFVMEDIDGRWIGFGMKMDY